MYALAAAATLPLAARADVDEVERQFWSARAVRRQYAAFDAECHCTRELFSEYARWQRELSRVLVLDGSVFRWEGLGNSGTRWIGLLRYGHATRRATYLRLSQAGGCGTPHGRRAGRPRAWLSNRCHLDLGDYFTGLSAVDWQWAGETERTVRAALEARKVDEHVISYTCARAASRGCAVARLSFANGSAIELAEPTELLSWLRTDAPRWIRLVLDQGAVSLEGSYAVPESLREGWGGGGKPALATCPIRGGRDYASRELALKCDTFAYMQPRRRRAMRSDCDSYRLMASLLPFPYETRSDRDSYRLMASLLPVLSRLEPYDLLVGVHLRSGIKVTSE